MASPVILLPPQAHTPGHIRAGSLPVPVGATYVEALLDRRSLSGHTSDAVASWALELSQDDGVTWLPWGGAATVLHESKVDRQDDGSLPSTSGFRITLSRDVENPRRRIRGALTLSEHTTTALTLVFDTEPLPVFRPPDVPHSVAYDNSVSVLGTNVTTLTTASFTIGSGSNRAAIAGLSTRSASVNPGTVTTTTVGGVSGTVISGTVLEDANFASTQLWSVINPASGSQTASMTWTNSVQGATLGVVTASGVDQTTPANNGTKTSGLFADPSLSVTSTSGDLTISNLAVRGTEVYTANQTIRWSQESGRLSGQTGDGTGSTTFTWTSNNQLGIWAQSAANFKQAVAGAFIPPKEFLLLGLGA